MDYRTKELASVSSSLLSRNYRVQAQPLLERRLILQEHDSIRGFVYLPFSLPKSGYRPRRALRLKGETWQGVSKATVH